MQSDSRTRGHQDSAADGRHRFVAHVQPLAGVAIAAVWLHEPLHWGQLWGGLAIVIGLVWGWSRQVKPA